MQVCIDCINYKAVSMCYLFKQMYYVKPCPPGRYQLLMMVLMGKR